MMFSEPIRIPFQERAENVWLELLGSLIQNEDKSKSKWLSRPCPKINKKIELPASQLILNTCIIIQNKCVALLQDPETSWTIHSDFTCFVYHSDNQLFAFYGCG